MKRWTKALAAILMLAGFIAPATFVQAQDAPRSVDEKKTEAEPALEEGKHSTDFETLGGLMFVKVKVNDKGPYDFLFDSGAQVSVISKRLADELDLETADMPGGGMQGVGKAEARATVVEEFEFAGFKRGKTGCGSLDMDHVSGGLGRHMMGIIGQNIMKQMKTITVDFSTSKLSFELYEEGEVQADMTEQAIIGAVEGGGAGIPGLPLPGLPGQPKEQPKEPKKEPKKDKDEEEFSMPALQPANYFLQDAEKETSPAHNGPREGMTVTYTTGSITIPIVNQTLEITPFWHVEAIINGKPRRFMFDTGASALLVLSDAFVEEMKLSTSFGFMVKGVAEGRASAGLVDSFEMGSVKETDVAFMSNALFKVSDQVKEQLGPLGRMMRGLDALDFDGIIGISFAHRFKTMTVNTTEKTIRFEAYEDSEANGSDPYEGESTMKDAVIRTWNGRAGAVGLEGDSVPLHEWESKGLENGGLMVESVEAEGPAAMAGLQAGDIILSVVDEKEGEMPVRDEPELIVYGCLNDPGSELTVRYKRGDDVKEARIKLSKYAWEGTFPERFKDK
jgi:predicted aspartyl protease